MTAGIEAPAGTALTLEARDLEHRFAPGRGLERVSFNVPGPGCVAVTGGQQIAFASLVDLKTGDVIWFNMLGSTVGDIHTPEGANHMVTKLLESINSELPQQPKRT